jgi:RHS repeat-associated protein
MPGRTGMSSNAYRYGFNGKENDPEDVSTAEGLQDYGMRFYNPSLGRFLSVDPLSPQYP